jgi:hypothetical protein
MLRLCESARNKALFLSAACLICLFFAGAPGALHAQQAASNSTEQTLTRMVERFTQAQVGYDPAVLGELTAPEYVEVSPLGEIDPREKMLGFYAPDKKDADAPTAEVSEVNVRVLGDFAVVLAKISFQPKSAENRAIVHALRETFVARSTPAGWKFVSAQYTSIYAH